MKPDHPTAPAETHDEVSTLVDRLHATERRLEELTQGEVHTAAGGSGRPFLLRRAQEQARQSETARQTAILNALPAHIALLDERGLIVAVNAAWRQFAIANGLPGDTGGVGDNYLEVCDRAVGLDADEAHPAAAGIRAVLTGAPVYSLEYPCHSPTAARWFLMTVSPLAGIRGQGAVVMHLDITERRRVEGELKAAKIAAVIQEGARRYDFLAETVPLILWTARPDGGADYFNQAWFDYTGRTLAQSRDWGWDAVVHPEDLARCRERWAHCCATGEDYEIAYRFRRAADGCYRWFLGRASARRTAGGTIVQWVGTGTDIDDQKRAETALRQTHAELEHRVEARTAELSRANAALQRENFERQRTEHALRESNTKFRQLADNITDAFWIRSPDLSEVHYVSPAFEQIWGRSVDVLYNHPQQWSEFVFPEDRARVSAAFAALTAVGPSLDIEYRIVRPDGELRWVRVRGFQVRDATDRPIRHIGVVTDITEQKQGDAALRESEKRFKALFEQAGVGVALVEAATGRLVQVNRRFAEIAGRPRDVLQELTLAALAPPQDAARDQEIMRQFHAGTLRDYSGEKRCTRGDGSEVWVSLTVSAMWVQGEPPSLTIAVVQDITARKQLEEQFRQAQKMEAVGTLAGGIAHDFNNILAAIGGYTELSLMVLQDNPAVREHLGQVLQAASRATDLVRQIMTFSRQQPINRCPMSLLPVVVESLKLLRATLPSTIAFDTALATDTPTVLADATQIHQIMMNLGTNAWHAMKDHPGRLHVTLERFVVDAALAAAQPALRPGAYACLSVTDTGCGMDQATQRRIFEPFFTTKMPGEGTGLGLAAVHGIVESHDGTVTVTSEPGKGTRFQLCFPAHVSALPAVPALADPVPRGQGERILVVDDEELLTGILQQVLEKLGYQVEAVTLPEQALALVAADPGRFGLVITDQTMPGLTGLALARELRLLRPTLPVILTTGYSVSLTPERLKAAGIVQLLLKPITLQSLGAAVHSALAAPATL